MKLLYIPFALQGLIMLGDEFYFHEKRGLPRWERIGHPLDTLTVFTCLASLAWTEISLPAYIGLSSFSCLFITKDEFIHTELCRGTEHWLHAMLFIIHPVCFLSAYFLAQSLFLKVQSLLILGFMFYQIIRWSLPWKIQSR